MGTNIFTPPGRKFEFYFYANGPGNTQVLETMNLGHRAFLETVHIILSDSMASTEPVVVKLSSILDSHFNNTLFSYSIEAFSNYFWQPSYPVYLLSGDQVLFSMTISACGKWGILATGWAIVEP